jgi:nitroreductase
VEATKKPTRDYPSYSDSPWSLWDTLYARRSHRKYLPSQVDDNLFASLREMVELAVSVRNAGGDSLVMVTEKTRVEKLKKNIHKGVQGKINLWLARAPLHGFLVLVLPKQDVASERPQLLPQTVMAAEDCILWLTEAGQGTCWLGGISQKGVKKVMGLGGEMFVPAVIPFGKPKPRVQARDIDHMMYRTVSRKRKPLSDIAHLETMGRPYLVSEIERKPFSASQVQDVAGLLLRLEEMSESEGDVDLGLAIDACLEAARISPSAGNAQTWNFVAVSGEDALRELAQACGIEGGWRAAIVGVGEPSIGFIYEIMEKPFWMMDLPIAFSQMSLMAASMGCGVDLCVDDIYEEEVNRLVGLSSGNLRTVGVLGIR